jgi:hypothetical protein
MNPGEKLYTIQTAAKVFFQGTVTGQHVRRLFLAGEITGFRTGVGKGKIVLFESGLLAYIDRNRNDRPQEKAPELIQAPEPLKKKKTRSKDNEIGPIRLNRMPIGPFHLNRMPEAM